MTTRYTGRFAPSPTGPLHFGSLVAALASYLDARANRGLWLLRIEDVDTTRCHEKHAEDIISTLHAFGFRWDGDVTVQSRRTPRYEAAMARLSHSGAAYPCTCTRREVADGGLAGIDGAPVYPGTCAARAAPVDAATPHAMRVRVSTASITFHDRVQGTFSQALHRDVGDFVVKRRDSLFAYQLAVVVDDADAEVTHVVRGADLLDSTARQIHLQRLLGVETPQYLHVPVATTSAGEKLSKQTEAEAVGAPDRARACQLLNRALLFLGQTPWPSARTPSSLLDFATGEWSPVAIPAVRGIPHSG
jgi:glutamyl-Q tRNA(Asp) synthetase